MKSFETKNSEHRTFSRRFFLFGLLGISAIASSLIVALRYALPTFVPQQKSAISWSALKRLPLGKLPAATLATLNAAQEALTGLSNQAHYQRLFTWHAEHSKGYLGLYQHFSEYVSDQANDNYDKEFIHCSSNERLVILEPILNSRSPSLAAEHKHPLLKQFDQYIIRKILSLYVRTDAWKAIGYHSYPGLPVGIYSYTKPLAGKDTTSS